MPPASAKRGSRTLPWGLNGRTLCFLSYTSMLQTMPMAWTSGSCVKSHGPFWNLKGTSRRTVGLDSNATCIHHRFTVALCINQDKLRAVLSSLRAQARQPMTRCRCTCLVTRGVWKVVLNERFRSWIFDKRVSADEFLDAVYPLCIDIMCLRCNTLRSKVNTIWHLLKYTHTHTHTHTTCTCSDKLRADYSEQIYIIL